MEGLICAYTTMRTNGRSRLPLDTDSRSTWLHNGWVTIGGEKISKSLGNSVAADALLRNVRPIDLRYYLGSAQYRSNLELDVPAMSAAAAMTRIEEFVARSAPAEPSGPERARRAGSAS